MDEERFGFKGTDKEYIKFLESWILSIQELHGLGLTAPCHPGLLPTARKLAAEGFQAVDCTQRPGQSTRLHWPKEEVPKWQKQLHRFVDDMPRASRWEEARAHAGLYTPISNQKAMKLILGHGSTALFHPGWHSAALSSVTYVENDNLVVRGYAYGNFIARCADDHKFAGHVIAFQNLVFCSYCVVMMRQGVSKKMTNHTMREFTGQARDDLTLEKYRHGALWANRCIASLLGKGWGHKSWELFLLNSRSPAQFSRFAANDTSSYTTVANKLGNASVPLWESPWIPYCIPCIVQHLTGYSVPLALICRALGYGQSESSYVQRISDYFSQGLNSMLASDSVPLVGPLHTQQEGTDSIL